MEHARECVEATRGKKEDMNKINTVRKHERECLPYEVLGEFGLKTTNCGRKELEVSSMCWKHKETANIISESKGKVISKSSYKVWNKFVTWLRLKKVKVIKYFK